MLEKTVALPVVCFGVAVVVWLSLLFVVCSWESAAVVMLLSLPVAYLRTRTGHSGLSSLLIQGSFGCQC
jgi:hypothetical protein